ncbi:hypothetical protein GCM10009690_04180 [Brevibacterium permense]|uniref:Uncharacterized protein n=1 Tax=Brevibacterium permense TaxID=234834 RepID=A0ABN1ZU49_9MICO
MAEAQRRQRTDADAVLVEPGGQADAIGEGQSHHLDGPDGAAGADEAEQTPEQGDGVKEPQGGEREVMGPFGIHRNEEKSEDQ